MGWLVTALALVWLVPLACVAIAALGYSSSRTFRAWFKDMLFGENRPSSPSPAISIEGVVRTVER